METLDGSSRVVDDAVNVGQALAILCQDFQTQVANRKYFYRSGKLSHHGIISLSRSRWHQGSGDLTDNRIILDRRVLDWAVGLDSEINELVEGSDLYDPKVNLSQVVLPTGHMQALLSQCICYDAFRQYRVAAGLQEVLSYGNSLVIMLCGKSGTGKTMTVNAIAKELKMKVLLVDFASLTGKRSEGGNDMDADLRGLFREAQMSNAVLFFDECEVVFRSRNTGGDRMLNSLLTEIERHEGIVFLATNRPYDLDEAMHRRITCVLEFRAPDHDMRRCIWENLLGIGDKHGYNNTTPLEIKDDDSESKQDNKTLNIAEHNIDKKTDKVLENISTSTNGSILTPQCLQLDPDVDVAEIAIKYELTGGFIKNAVLSALLSSISRNKLSPVINQEDLKQGCKLQMRGALTQRSYEDKVIATNGFDDIDLSPTLIDAAETIIRFEKARAKVYGSWSSICNSLDLGSIFKENARKSLPGGDNKITTTSNSQKACICALAGPKGSGKRTFMKALAFDLGRNIKMVHVAELMSGSISDTILSIQTLVQDARLSDAIVVIDGFEHVLDEGAAGAGEGGWRLHLLLSRMLGVLHSFPGCVILICHMDSPQNLTLQQDLAMQLFCFLRFVVPPYSVRAKLWQRLLPGNAPLSKDISFIELGRRFEIQAGSIRAAIARASAEAAMREINRSIITQKDLISAGDAEVAKLRGGNFELISKLFT
jgi:SpoVK/Ycf46/Vps4 family AAA+-type ATPase